MKFAALLPTQVRNSKKGKKMNLQRQMVFFHPYVPTRVTEGAVEKQRAQNIFQQKDDPREIGGGKMTVPVSAGRRRRLWTPSSSRGRGAARRPSGKPSARRDSRERSRSFWFPTTWQQLEAKDWFRQSGFTRGLHHRCYFEALAPRSMYAGRLLPGWSHC